MRRKRLISGLQAEAGALQQPLLRGTEQAQPGGGGGGGEVRTKNCLRPARSHLGGCHCLCLLCRSDLAAGRSSIYSSQRARSPGKPLPSAHRIVWLDQIIGASCLYKLSGHCPNSFSFLQSFNNGTTKARLQKKNGKMCEF